MPVESASIVRKTYEMATKRIADRGSKYFNLKEILVFKAYLRANSGLPNKKIEQIVADLILLEKLFIGKPPQTTTNKKEGVKVKGDGNGGVVDAILSAKQKNEG